MVEITEETSLGPTILRWSDRSTRLSLRVYEDGRVVVLAPTGHSPKEMMSFAESKRAFVEAARQKLQQRSAKLEPPMGIEPGSEVRFAGQVARVVSGQPDLYSLLTTHRDEQGNYTIYVSPALQSDAERCREAVRATLLSLINQAAQKALPPELNATTAAAGLPAAYCSVRTMRSQWGSCTAEGRISLNADLVRLPEALRRFVMLHELTHRQHMDHGPEFHSELDGLCQRVLGRGERELARELRRWRIEG